MLIRTDSDLFDLIHRLFGVGTWDEEKEPWWKWRQREVSKLKRSRLSRHVDIADMATAAYFCKAQGIDIRNGTWLYQHILPAIRWQAERDRREAQTYLTEEMERAMHKEFIHQSDGWYDRLQRTLQPALTLSEWKAAGRDV